MFFSRSAEQKRIDYVLVYGKDTTDDTRKNDKRKEFEEGLVAAGLELEHEDIEVQYSSIYNTTLDLHSRSTKYSHGCKDRCSYQDSSFFFIGELQRGALPYIYTGDLMPNVPISCLPLGRVDSEVQRLKVISKVFS